MGVAGIDCWCQGFANGIFVILNENDHPFALPEGVVCGP